MPLRSSLKNNWYDKFCIIMYATAWHTYISFRDSRRLVIGSDLRNEKWIGETQGIMRTAKWC